jgi:hypothetical protein
VRFGGTHHPRSDFECGLLLAIEKQGFQDDFPPHIEQRLQLGIEIVEVRSHLEEMWMD